MRREAMFALHHELIEVADQLARCYCLIGSYCDAARYIKVCLPAVEERQVLTLVWNVRVSKTIYFFSGSGEIVLSWATSSSSTLTYWQTSFKTQGPRTVMPSKDCPNANQPWSGVQKSSNFTTARGTTPTKKLWRSSRRRSLLRP